jgi:hypothetical protein
VWKRREDDNCGEQSHIVIVNSDDYEISGIPKCSCGRNMTYSHSEMFLQAHAVVAVLGGIPHKLYTSPGVNLVIIDNNDVDISEDVGFYETARLTAERAKEEDNIIEVPLRNEEKASV